MPRTPSLSFAILLATNRTAVSSKDGITARPCTASNLSSARRFTSIGGSGDAGAAVQALLDGLQDMAMEPDGSLYIVKSRGHVRRSPPDGIIRTVIGAGG